ncbi:MAG TPA: cation:proton antiporter [Atopostipes sp.]|nr:cation:proton antiporter [Atopostipes sp.]
MDLFLKISIIILVGLLGGRIAKKFGLPSVSGYIVAGLLLGPSFIDLVSNEGLNSLGFITDIALAAIAFSIGNEFLLSDMKKVGNKIFLLTIAEVIGVLVIVFMTMYFLFNQSFEFSIVIASMSAATAPAGIVMVIRELRADGPLVKTILPVVALDDALGIMVFSVALSIAKMTSGLADFTLIQIVSDPLIEIFGSLLLGFLLGLGLTYLANKAKGRDELLKISLAFILAAVGAANFFNMSPLLTAMMMGGTLVNLMHNSKRVFDNINSFTPPINLLFFTLAGMSLDLKILASVGMLGIGYILARAIGKMLGAGVGAKALGESETIQKYLGLSLLTQGGISIGLSVIVRNELPQFSQSIVTVILFSVLVFEILGPILAKIAITKAGEVNGMVKKKKRI